MSHSVQISSNLSLAYIYLLSRYVHRAMPTQGRECAFTSSSFISEDSFQPTGAHSACMNRELKVLEEHVFPPGYKSIKARALLPQKVTTEVWHITQSSQWDPAQVTLFGTSPEITSLLGFLPVPALFSHFLTGLRWEHFLNKSLANFWRISGTTIG